MVMANILHVYTPIRCLSWNTQFTNVAIYMYTCVHKREWDLQWDLSSVQKEQARKACVYKMNQLKGKEKIDRRPQ